MRTATRRLASALALAVSTALVAAASSAAGPIGMVCTNGTTPARPRAFDLTARTGTPRRRTATASLVWSYAVTGASFQTTGPVLCVNQGDAVTVTLHNSLPENASIVFPGQEGVNTSGGASAGSSPARPRPAATSRTPSRRPSRAPTSTRAAPTDQAGRDGARRRAGRAPGRPPRLGLRRQLDPVRSEARVPAPLQRDRPRASPRRRDGRRLRHQRPAQPLLHGQRPRVPRHDPGQRRVWLPNQPYGALVRVQPYNATHATGCRRYPDDQRRAS